MSTIMLSDGLIQIKTSCKTMAFARIFGSLAWPQHASGHFVVIGEKRDGCFRVLAETSGGLLELGKAALRAKSVYMTDSIIVDDSDTVSTTSLRNLEGLTFTPRPIDNKRLVVDRRKRRPDLDELRDGVAVIPVAREITGNYRGALERTRVLIMTRRIIIDENDTPSLAHDLTQPMNFVLESAPVRALVLASGSMENYACMEYSGRMTKMWYKNMARS